MLIKKEKKDLIKIPNNFWKFKLQSILKIKKQIKPTVSKIYQNEKLTKIEKKDINYFKIKNHINQMFSKQHINRVYNKKQLKCSKRIFYIKKIYFYHKFFNYQKKTLHLAISYMDLVFSRCDIKQKEINLILYVSLNLAAKFHEKKKKIPYFEKSVEILNYQYNLKQIGNCENVIFKDILKFKLNLVTPFCFLNQFFFFDILKQDYSKNSFVKNKLILILKNFSFKILEFSLKFYESYQYLSSTIAAVCIYCSRKLLGFSPWNKFLSYLTEINFECIKKFGEFIYENYLQENFKDIYLILKYNQFVKNNINENNDFLKNSENGIRNSKKKYSYSLEKELKKDKNLNL